MAVKPGIYAASMSCFYKDFSLDIDSTILHVEKIIKDGYELVKSLKIKGVTNI